MINFYFVRHGVKESMPFDPPLTKLGLKQAKATAKFLKNIKFKEVVVSPKLRTRQTAMEIVKELSASMSIDDRLQERLEWEYNQEFGEFTREWCKTDLDRGYKPKNGKSSRDKGKEFKKVIDELSKKHKNGNVLIVAHGGSIADFLRNVFGQENLPHITHPISGAKYMKINECSVTVVSKDKEKYRLIKLSGKNHLE